eukprot:6062004-Ditylum_brightwellii.AAC.1
MDISFLCCFFVKDVAASLYVTAGMYTVLYARSTSCCLKGHTTIAHPNLKVMPCLCSNSVSIWSEPVWRTPSILDPL